MHPFLDLLARPLRSLFQWLLALIVLFEEWGWEPLARLMAQLAQLPLIGWLERRIARLPPALALGVFLAPGLMLQPKVLLLDEPLSALDPFLRLTSSPP